MKFFKELVDTSAWLARLPCCCMKFDLVGSALYREDPKDLDILVLVPVDKTYRTVCNDLVVKHGYSYCEDYDTGDGEWRAVRKGNVNLIVVNEPDYYASMKLASDVCAVLSLERKTDRVRVHRVIRDGMDWQQAKEAPMREGVQD